MKLIECSIWASVISSVPLNPNYSNNDFCIFIFFVVFCCLEPQVRSICNHVRPDRQTLLFSATFKKRIEKLARDVLTDPVRIVQGDVGEANTDVTQHVLVFNNNPTGKWNWLLRTIVEHLSAGSLLIFVTKKVRHQM